MICERVQFGHNNSDLHYRFQVQNTYFHLHHYHCEINFTEIMEYAKLFLFLAYISIICFFIRKYVFTTKFKIMNETYSHAHTHSTQQEVVEQICTTASVFVESLFFRY